MSQYKDMGRVIVSVKVTNLFDTRKAVKAAFDVIAEDEGTKPLIGQVVLELLDLLVDPKRMKLIPNPASPDTPMMELLRINEQ